MVEQVYRARKPKASPLWQCKSRHFDSFLAGYEERYQPRYGFLRRIIPEVVNKFLDCGDLERGFARVRCDHCKHEYLLAFSCKGRWFCPSCHQKKVQLFGALLTETILFPVPHRHFTFAIPKMLRPYFRFDRNLLKDLCHIAHESLLEYLRTTLDLPDGLPGIVMAIHTFFNVHRSRRVLPGEREDLERLAQYTRLQRYAQHCGQVIRNPFAVEKMQVGAPNRSNPDESVIYVSEHKPRRIPSAKWRELIKKVWEADPLLCPRCSREMKIVALIDDRAVIERILRHLGLWEQSVRVTPATGPPPQTVIEPWLDDPFPDCDTEPVIAYANG